jgi:cytochrome c-type biogenesis protein CcmH
LRQLPRLRSLRLAVALYFVVIAVGVAQEITNYLTPGVARVGAKLACRCGGCKESIGQCPMIRCESADPMRRRIYDMQAKGVSDDAIVKTIVNEQGTVALAGQQPLAWIAWLMPPIALLIGFGIYSSWVKRNRTPQPAKLTADEEATLERFHKQIDREVSDEAGDRS